MTVVVCVIAISPRSLWIDEALTALAAMQPTLDSWWHRLVQQKTSDLQMPLYMLFMWAYEKVFGSSEWALRLANLLWFVPGAVVFIAAVTSDEWRVTRAVAPGSLCKCTSFVTVSFLVLFSPFAWYYLDEARPYAMQIGASFLIAAALFRFEEGRYVGKFLFGLALLCGSSLLGMVWTAAAIGVLFVLLIGARTALSARTSVAAQEHAEKAVRAPSTGQAWLCFLMAMALLIPFGFYYLWTMKVGARASASAKTGLSNLFFSAYELLGFGGLGPGRLEIRTQGLTSFREHWPAVILYVLTLTTILGAAILSGWRRFPLSPSDGERAEVRAQPFRHRFAIAICCAAPMALISVAGMLLHFRVLGRHFAPVLPVLLLWLASGLRILWSGGKWWGRPLGLVFCGLTIYSCLSLRFAARHGKDDYRKAAALARTALREGRTVWWNAAEEGAQYYRLPLAHVPEQRNSGAVLVANPSRETLATLPAPQVIFTSRSDIYDNASSVQAYVQEHHFAVITNFTAFTIWQR